MITLFLPVTFNVAGLLLLWNLRSPSGEHSPATSCSLPPRRLAGRSVPVRLTNHRTEGRCWPSASCKAFWNEGLETHLFRGIPTQRDTNRNQNSSAVVCGNLWTLFPACDIIFLPDFKVKNSPEKPLNYLLSQSLKPSMDCVCVYHLEDM